MSFPFKKGLSVVLIAFLFALSFPFSNTVAHAQVDGGYNNIGNPCPPDELGTAACQYDSNGDYVDPSAVHTGPNGSAYQLPELVTTAKSSNCPTTPSTLGDVLCILTGIINTLLPIVAAMTLIVFFWGLIGVIRNAGDVKEVEKGKKIMIWGIIGLFVMFSIWGILNFFLGDFFGTTVGVPQLPQ